MFETELQKHAWRRSWDFIALMEENAQGIKVILLLFMLSQHTVNSRYHQPPPDMPRPQLLDCKDSCRCEQDANPCLVLTAVALFNNKAKDFTLV